MTEPTQSDLRAVAALLELVDRVERAEQHRAANGGPPYRTNAWFALRLLIDAIPPDRRLRAIDQVMEFADAEVMRRPDFVSAVETWDAPVADAFLTHITDLTIDRAHEVFRVIPERLQAFHEQLAATGAEDLLGTEGIEAAPKGEQ